MTDTMNLTYCDYSDIFRVTCHHCMIVGYEPTEAETSWLAGAFDRTPAQLRSAATPIPELDYSRRRWAGMDRGRRDNPKPAIVDCNHPSDNWYLCPDCASILELCLSDLPALLNDLNLAITNQTRFIEHGTLEQPSQPEHVIDRIPAGYLKVPFNRAASNARQTLIRAIRNAKGFAPNVAGLTDTETVDYAAEAIQDLTRQDDATFAASRITRAIATAHNTIDRPRDWQFLGYCPAPQEDGHPCKRELNAEMGDEYVTCDCGQYTAKVEDHIAGALDGIDDQLMTDSELIGAVLLAGEPIRRTQIHSWAKTGRIEPHFRIKPVLRRDGTLGSEKIRVYRLGDVRTLAAEAERKRAS